MRRFNLTVTLIIVSGLLVLLPLQIWLDQRTGNRTATETLYLPSGQAVKRLSFGFDGLLADIYWLRAVQYFGRKALAGGLQVDSNERFDLLFPLLDIATTLDPQYIIAYQFGGMFIADYNSHEKAVSLLERGIAANPQEWRLYQYLGVIYWRQKDYKKASEAFQRGGQVAGAPAFMRAMAAQMLAEGGSRQTARQIFQQVYETADDPIIKNNMQAKLKRLTALDQIDCLQQLTQSYDRQTGRYPANLNLPAIAGQLKDEARRILDQCTPLTMNEQGLAVDPNGFAYAYDRQTGAVTLAADTTILKH